MASKLFFKKTAEKSINFELVNNQCLTKYCREFLLNDEQINNVDDYCEVFSNLLKNGIQRSKQKKSFRKFSKQMEPWYTPEYLELVKATNYFWIKLKKFPNNVSIRNDYRSYRNRKNKLRNQLLRKHSEKCIELGKDKPKKLWKIINETLKGNDSVRRNNCIESLKFMGRVVVHQKDIANALNEMLCQTTNVSGLLSCTTFNYSP